MKDLTWNGKNLADFKALGLDTVVDENGWVTIGNFKHERAKVVAQGEDPVTEMVPLHSENHWILRPGDTLVQNPLYGNERALPIWRDLKYEVIPAN